MVYPPLPPQIPHTAERVRATALDVDIAKVNRELDELRALRSELAGLASTMRSAVAHADRVYRKTTLSPAGGVARGRLTSAEEGVELWRRGTDAEIFRLSTRLQSLSRERALVRYP